MDTLAKTQTILSRLAETFSAGAASQYLRQLMRVPLIWEAVHEEAFLDRLFDRMADQTFIPSLAAATALDLDALPSAQISLPDEVEAEIEEAWERACTALAGPEDMRQLALLTIAIDRESQRSGAMDGIVEWALEHPLIWRSALACQWPQVADPSQYLQTWFDHGSEGFSMAAWILLANENPQEAARIMFGQGGRSSNWLLQNALKSGELQLAEVFAQLSEAETNYTTQVSIEQVLDQAMRRIANGDSSAAQSALGTAWEMTSKLTGEVADWIALTAEQNGDPIVAAEAWNQAIQIQPTSNRRARLAVCYCQAGLLEEARAALPEAPDSIEEQIALASILTASNARQPALELLHQVNGAIQHDQSMHPAWLRELVNSLAALGDIKTATRLIPDMLSWCPPEAGLHFKLGELFLSGSEPRNALKHALIANVMSPQDAEIHVLLARSFDANGQHAAASDLWQTICQSEPHFRIEFAASALSAGTPEKALQTAVEVLEDDPTSLEAKSLLGSALIELDRHDEALAFLEETVASAPHSPKAWLALAECRGRLSDIETEEKTLRDGLEAIPDSDVIHFRLAKLLHKQSQDQVARHHVDEAIKHGEPRAEHYALQASILTQLGQNEEALRAYEAAFQLAPAEWKRRADLAHAYYAHQQIQKAGEVLLDLPETADLTAHELAARVFSQLAADDPSLQEEALSRIQTAQAMGSQDPRLIFELATLLEKTGKFGPAFFAFRQYLNHQSGQEGDFRLEATLGVARTALETDQAVVAIATLEQGIKDFPASLDVLRMLSPAYIHAGMNQRALITARQAVELAPGNPDLLRILSMAAAHNQEWDEAIDSLEIIVSQEGNSPGTLLNLADIALQAERLPRARQAIADALSQAARQDPVILQRASDVIGRSGNYRFAHSLLKRAFNLNTDSLELARQFADLSEQLDRPESAFQGWLRASELEAGEFEYLDKAAAALWKLGRRAEAIGLWQRSLALDPENVSLHRTLAVAMLENGEVQPALEHYNQALELEPDNLSLLLDVAEVISQYGTPGEAAELYERAIALQPGSIKAALGLAKCWLQVNQPQKARQSLVGVLSTQNNNPFKAQANAMLAVAALQMGDLSEAARAFQHANSSQDEGFDLDRWLSRAALRMGRWEDALDIIERDRSALTPEVVTEMLTCRLRIEDARRLYQTISHADSHSPKVLESHNQGQIGDLLIWLSRRVSSSPWVNEVRTWQTIHNNEAEWNTLIQSIQASTIRPEAVHALAITLLVHDEPELAVNFLEQSTLQLDTDHWGSLLLGYGQFRLEKYALARETLQTAAQNPIIAPMVNYHTAQCWLAEGDADQALVNLNAAVSAWADEPVWHYELAMLYKTLQHSDAALPHFQRAAELDPKNAAYTLAYARCLQQAGHLSDALAAYAHALKLDHGNPKIYKEAGLLALANGDPARAEQWLSEASMSLSDDPQCLIGAARAAQKLGNLARAEELAQAAHRMAPDQPEVLMGIGEITASKGKLEHALDYYDRALELSPDQTSVYIAKSKLLLNSNKPKEAIQTLETAAENAPDNDQVLGLLAEAYENIGKLDQAMTVSARALTIAPLNPNHRLQMGRISRKAGQLDRAVDELSRAEKDHPTDSAFPLELGKAYEARADYKRALQAYQRSISLNPAAAEPLYRAGLLLKSQKAYSQACHLLERAAEIASNDPDILHQLAAVRALALVHGGISRSVVST